MAEVHRGGLTLGKDGYLYGTTYGGGSNKVGTVYRIAPRGGTPSILWHFKNGWLPRLPRGQEHSEQEKLDAAGSYPTTPPVQATDGNFYGVTSYANNQKYGVLYRIGAGGGFRALYFFDGQDGRGRHPSALVAGADDNLYGTTYFGSITGKGLGTVFKATTSGSVSTLHEFDGATGSGPLSLLYGSDGNLYGTTYGGGSGPGGGKGVVFKVNLAWTGVLDALDKLRAEHGAFEVLHKLNGTTDGFAPFAGMVEAADGFLYGAARYGGGRNGVLYVIDKAGKSYRPLHYFDMYRTGHSPMGTPVQHSNTNLYGTTYQGGKFGNGGVYCLSFPACSPPGRPVQPDLKGGVTVYEDEYMAVRTNVTVTHPTVAVGPRDAISIQVKCDSTNNPHIVQFISRYYVGTNGLPVAAFYDTRDQTGSTNSWPTTTNLDDPRWRIDSLGQPNPYYESGGGFRLDCDSLTTFDEPALGGNPREYRYQQVTAKVFVICGGRVVRSFSWYRELTTGQKPMYWVIPPKLLNPAEFEKFRKISDSSAYDAWP
jgi:uncharacterized repeat protein (TIGR03803 family)